MIVALSRVNIFFLLLLLLSKANVKSTALCGMQKKKNQAGFTENSHGSACTEFLEQLVLVQRSVPVANSIDLYHH